MVIDSGFASGEIEMLTQSLVLFVTFIGVLTVGTFVRFYFVSWVGERVSADIRLAVFDHLIHMHPGYFEDNAPSEIQSRITTDTTLLQTVIGSSVSIALRNILMFFGGMVLLFLTNAKLSLIVLSSVPFVVLPVIFFGRRVRTLSRSSQDRLADVGSHAGESFRHIKVVQAFNHQDADTRSFNARVEEALRVSLQRVWLRSVLIAVVMLLVFGAIAMLLWVGGQDVLAGNTSPGDLAAFIFYAFIVAGSVGAISEVWSDLQRAAGATERLVEILQSPWAIVDGSGPGQTSSEHLHGLSLQGVNFTYPSRPEQAVLQGVSFAIAPGEMVALVGPSGAGKSTLFDLLQRFYDPSSGVIALGDDDIRSLKLRDLRGTFGFVPQDPVLFAGSLRENLTYAKEDASDEEVAIALRAANAQDFIAALPNGLDTRVGEGGIGLSGGQRQRIALARVILKDAPILLLDEATSALDSEVEAAIQDTLYGMMEGKTVIAIAHRLSTIAHMDRILVMDEGRIVEDGSHSELLAQGGLYAGFWARQSGGFIDVA